MAATIHELKCWPEYFQPTWNGVKNFELRFNDRSYKRGDVLKLREFDPTTGEYTGREMVRRVVHVIYNGPWLQPGYVAMSISRGRNTWGAQWEIRKQEYQKREQERS